jgi:ribosomal protein S18 acetylase RimI-like enzyme
MASVRPCSPEDRPALLALWSAVLHDPAPHNDPEISLKKKLEMDDGLLLVAHEGRTVVGSVMGGYDGHRGWIYALAVRPEHRRKGIGTALCRHLEQQLIDRGCLKLNLQVRSENAQVIAFYEQLGYSVEDRLSLGKRLY